MNEELKQFICRPKYGSKIKVYINGTAIFGYCKGITTAIVKKVNQEIAIVEPCSEVWTANESDYCLDEEKVQIINQVNN